MPTIDFMTAAASLREELIARRRDLHRHPELAFEEVRTSRIVAEELTRLGLEVQTGVAKTGVVGLLEGADDGPTVLVRADMDALPILEENQTNYVSTLPGKMHACGHDGHTAVALGVAKLLSTYRDNIVGRVKFVFQPAEEEGAGAAAMIADGVLENPRPDVSLGLHLWNELPLGKLGVADGPVMASPSIFKIRIVGKGGHGALPDQSNDPIVCAAQLITALQTVVSRNVPPLESAVLSVTTIHAGSAFNVIPGQAELTGTLRTFKPDVRDMVSQRIEAITENLCRAMGCTATVEIDHFTEAVTNHPEVADTVRGVFRQLVGDSNLILDERTMAAEDMSLLMNDIPGMFFFVGSANAERGLNYGHHHPRFDFDEEALPLAVALMTAAVAAYVLPEG